MTHKHEHEESLRDGPIACEVCREREYDFVCVCGQHYCRFCAGIDYACPRHKPQPIPAREKP